MRIPEITLNTNFGQDIVKYLFKFNIKKAIEIGSGSGNGSTQSFLYYFDNVNDPEKELHCFEPMVSWFLDLKEITKDRNYCKLYNESAISYHDLLVKDYDNDFYYSEFNKLKNYYSKDLMKTWYDQDVEFFKQTEKSILPSIEAEAILIDGCEFSGYSEFKKINESINLIILDDCLTAFKNNQTFHELCQNKQWQVLKVGDERHGYAFFGRK